MKAKVEVQKDLQKEQQHTEKTRGCYYDPDSEVWQYFAKVDEELRKEYDYSSLFDDENS